MKAAYFFSTSVDTSLKHVCIHSHESHNINSNFREAVLHLFGFESVFCVIYSFHRVPGSLETPRKLRQIKQDF